MARRYQACNEPGYSGGQDGANASRPVPHPFYPAGWAMALRANNTGWQVSPTISDASLGGNVEDLWFHYRFKVHKFPSNNNGRQVMGLRIRNNQEGVGPDIYVVITSSGGLEVKSIGNSAVGSSGDIIMASTSGIELNRWYRMEIHGIRNTETQTGGSPPVETNARCTVFLDGSQIGDYDPTTCDAASGLNNHNATSYSTCELDLNTFSTDATATDGEIDFADFVIDDANQVDNSNVFGIFPIDRGSLDAGAWTTMQRLYKHPYQSVNGGANSSTSSGVLSLLLPTLRSLGINGSTKGSFVSLNMTGSNFTPSRTSIYINGVETTGTPVAITTGSTPTATAIVRISGVTIAPDDVIEIRLDKDATVTARDIRRFYLTVEVSASDVVEPEPDMDIQTAIIVYDGNAATDRFIPTAFEPSFIWIMGASGANIASIDPYFWDKYNRCAAVWDNGNTTGDVIYNVTTSGFWISSIGEGTNINLNSNRYVALLIKDHGERMMFGDAFKNNGQDNYNVLFRPEFEGIRPDWIFAEQRGVNVNAGVMMIWAKRMDETVADSTYQYGSQQGTFGNIIQAVASGSMTTGNASNFTGSNHNIMYWGFREDQFIGTTLFETVKWDGQGGAPNRTISLSDPTRKVKIAMVVPAGGSFGSSSANRTGYLKTEHIAGNASYQMTGTTNNTGGIRSIATPGQFEVGTNLNASGISYVAMLWYEGVDVFQIEHRVTQQVVLTMAPNRVACPTPDEGEDLCTIVDNPILFASHDFGDGTKHWFAQTCLDDDLDYYGGWKEDRLLSVSTVRRSLSGPNLDYEVGSYTVEYADEDYFIRTQLASAPGKYYSKREQEVYMITPDGRNESSAAKRVATGFVDADPTFDDRSEAMSVKFTMRDRIGAAMGWTSTGQSQVPRRVLTVGNLPGVDPAAVGLACPIPYGVLSTNVAASGVFSAPIHDVDATHCGFFDGIYPSAGFANWFNPPAQPSTATATPLPGGEMKQETPHNEGRYYFQVFPVAANGDVGDPYPFCPDGLFADVTTGGNQTIEVAWPAASGAAKYIVVCGVFYYGVRPQQYIETTALSCQFTRSPVWLGETTLDTITPGARFPEDAAITYYHVRAKNGVTLSELSPSQSFQSVTFQAGFNCSNGARFRPVRVWWQSTGAPEYEVLSKGPGGPITGTFYDWKWIVPSGQYDPIAGLHYFDNDFLYLDAIPLGAEETRPVGAVKPFYTRDVVLPDTDTWREFLIAGCAINNVDDWYYDPGSGPSDSVEINQGDGTEWLFPKAGSAWDAVFPARYRDVVGIDGRTRRFTLGYGKGPKADLVASGTALLTLNLKGVERSGASTGDVITDLHEQFQHLLENHIMVSGEGYMSGAWSPGQTMGFEGICVIDGQAFTDLIGMRDDEIDGGLVGAGVVGANGEQVTVGEEIKRWCVCGDFRIGPNRHWQVTAQALNENLTIDDTAELKDEFDIHVRSFKPSLRLGELANVLPYRYNKDFVTGNWRNDNNLYTNDESIANWSQDWRRLEPLEFHYLADVTQVQFVLGKHSRRRANAPTYIVAEGSLCLMSEEYDIGKYVRMWHWRGIQNEGWAGRPMWILSSEFDPASQRVRLELLDVGDLVPAIATDSMPVTMTFEMGG